MNAPADLESRFRKIRLLLLDVDGVLTDGRIAYTGADREALAFDVKDGLGIVLARRAGLKVGLLSGRGSDPLKRRARELEVDVLYADCRDKRFALREILERFEIGAEETAYVGDDWPDLPVLAAVGLPIAVADAVREVKDAAVWTTDRPGGRGAVREVVHRILDAQGKRKKLADEARATN